MKQVGHFGGTYSNFRCVQCKKIKEFPIGATVRSWSPALKRDGKCLCSLACARAWDRERKAKRKSSGSGRSYTEADNLAIRRMRSEGRTWQEVADELGRSVKAVERHYSSCIKAMEAG